MPKSVSRLRVTPKPAPKATLQKKTATPMRRHTSPEDEVSGCSWPLGRFARSKTCVNEMLCNARNRIGAGKRWREWRKGGGGREPWEYGERVAGMQGRENGGDLARLQPQGSDCNQKGPSTNEYALSVGTQYTGCSPTRGCQGSVVHLWVSLGLLCLSSRGLLFIHISPLS